ncbi:tape measure protein [Leuconostoc mesenteroides]|uniref:tape measure protein n=1 Tax=Leuconostoc mesenteroides TaxID=1245 RepID=UPI001CBAC5FE|nr:tape measure protein [Leuconostoc mesenteroides]MBZ1511052.1 tape measure protein [Leuconostoc mesenteroides]
MADGSINIDLLLNDQTDKTWSEFKSKAETAGKSGYDKFKDAFKGDPLVAKLETKANKAGIKNFRELLNQLPKEKQTELLTKAEKGEAINYEKLLREIPSKITSQVELNDNASTGLRSLKNQAEEVGDKFHRLKDIAIGTFVGSTISAGVRTVAGFISGLGQEALNSSDALQKFKSTMQLGGFGEDEIDKATKQVKKYADDTVYDLNTVSNTTAQLAANGVKDYLGLTEAAGNLNAQAGGNADTFKSVAMVLTQTAGAGKLTTENWNQMADAIPGASGVLQKALKENGAFTGNFRDAMADGQITADEFNDALTKLGSNDAAKKAATSTNTFEGAWGSLEANVVSGLDNMINKIGKKNLTGIINQLADVSTSAFGAMGKAVANVFGYINDHKKDITGILNSLKEISGALIGGAWDVAKDTITGIASAFGLISKDSKKAHNPLKTLNDVLGKIAEHKSLIKALGAAIATAFAIKKVSDFVGATKAVITNLKLATLAQKAFNLATKANPLGLVITALIALGVAFYELYKHNEKFKGFVDGIVKSVGNAFGKVAKVAGDLFNSFKEAMKPITDSLVVLGMSIGEVFGDSWKALTKAFKPFVTLFKSMFNGVGERISKLAKPFEKLGGKVGKVFSSLKDSLKDLIAPFTHAGDKGGPIQAVVEKLDGISRWFIANKKVFTDIAGVIGKVLGAAFVALGAIIRGTFELIVPLVKPTFNILVAIVKGTLGVISGLFKALGSTIALILDVITGNWKHVGKDVKGIVSGLGKIVTSILKAMVSAVGNIFHGLVKAIDKALWGLGAGTKPLESFVKAVKKIFNSLIKWIEKAWNGTVKFLSKIWNPVQKTWNKAWKLIQKAFEFVWKILSKFIKNEFNFWKKLFTVTLNFITKIWNMAWNAISKTFESIWNGIKKFFKPIIEWLSDIISDTMKFISKAWNKVWQSISDFFGDIWKSIKKTGSNSVNSLSDTISGVMKTIDGVWRGMWKGLSDFFGGIWKDIKGYAEDGINGVVKVINAGVDGIDSVWKFFTGHETSVKHLKPVKLAAGGVIGGESQLAMVNDGAGSNWKELIQLPNGEMTMSNKRNHIMPLPKGTRVYNGEETKSIMGMAGIKKYADGGIVGDAIDWGKGKLSDVGSWIGDKMEAITKFLKNPASAIKGIITKSTSGLMNGLGHYGEIATGTFDKLTGSIASWFSKGLKKVQDEEQGDGGGGKGAPSGSGVTRWKSQVVDALKANGLSTSSDMVNKVLRQIATESGGNEKAVQGNIGDINNKTGDLAKGLMQVITSTFNANKFPGHNNPFNGYDSLLAGLNYAKKTYGSNLSFLGQGHGYANGGRTNGIGIVGEVEGEDEWVTNPNRSTADTNIIGSIKETAQKQPNSFAAKLAGVINGAKSGMQAITSQQPIIAGSSAMQSTNGGIDLSGDVHMTVQLDSGEIARATYPKIKVLRNQEIQMKGQATGNTYVY